jgi:hypothetical protein
MKKLTSSTLGLGIAFLAMFVSSGRAAPMGTAFNYQGHLAVNGTAANGLYDFSFALFDDPAAGTQQGSTLSLPGLTVTDGSFTVSLDFGSVFDGNGRWLAISVGTNGAARLTGLTPRQSVMPTPYALYAMTGPAGTVASNSITSAQLATDSSSLGKITGNNVIETSNGRVGIGTSTPGTLLQISGNSYSTSSSDGLFNVGPDAFHGASYLTFDGASVQARNSPGSSQPFYINWDGGDVDIGDGTLHAAYRGNVGIGTPNPATTLDVNGTVTATAFAGNGAGLTGLPALAVANNSITSAQLASDPASLGKVTGGNVTLDSNGDLWPNAIFLNSSHDLYLRDDLNHGLGWYGVGKTFAGASVDGPVLFGYSGGALGTEQGGTEKISLSWTPSGAVGIGKTDPATALDVNGTVTATAFVGNGAGLTGLPAPTIANNSITDAQLANDSSSLGKITGTSLNQTTAGIGVFTAAPYWPLAVQGQPGGTMFSWRNGPTYIQDLGRLGDSSGGYMWLYNSSGNIAAAIQAGGASYFKGGNVGIGKTTPATALDVNGTVTATAFVGNGAGLTGLPAPTVAGNSITSAQLASDPASLGKMTGGMSSDSNGDTFLNNHNLFLRSDDNHGVGWFGAGKTFAGASPDGPVLFGYSGGALGTERYGTETIALSWTTNGAVGIGKTSPSSALDVNGTVTATAFVGNGAGLTGLPAPTVANNSITDAQLASTTASLGKITGGKMIETSGGNVGVGTTTPGTLLQVAGSPFINGSHDGLVNIGPDGTHGSTYLTFDGASIQARSSPSSGQPCYLNWNGGDVDIGDYTLHAYYNGGVTVGTTASPGSYKLYVGGNAYCTGSWSGSDARWKKNVEPVTHALEKVTHLQGVTYDWRRDEFPDRNFDEGTQLGFLAQEVEKVVPEAVHTDAEGYKAVAYEKLTAVLTEGVKEQQTEIESLKARNAALEKDVTELKALVNKLLAK